MPTRVLLAFAAAAVGSAVAPTARAEIALSPGHTELLFLGTSGGPPLRRERSEPATLIGVDGRTYLIDCGIGTMQRMQQANVDPTTIRTIFLTHLHSDHDLGLVDVLGDVFFMLNLRGSPETIGIYGPPQTKELLDAAFRFITIAARPFAVENPLGYHTAAGQFVNPFAVHEIDRSGLVYQDDKIRVTAVENSHYSLMTPQQRRTFKSYSYRIETPHGSIVLTGDTGPSEAVTRLARGADVLVAEADAIDPAGRDQFIAQMGLRNHWPAERTRRFRAHFISEHLDTEEIGQMAGTAGVKAVILYHYDPGSKAEQAEYVSRVKRSFSGPVFAPDDLDRYCLTAGTIASCPGTEENGGRTRART